MPRENIEHPMNPEGDLVKTEVIHEFAKKDLDDILAIERACFPASWIYTDAEEYYTAAMNDNSAIKLFLREQEKRVGYLVAVLLPTIYDILVKADPELQHQEQLYYLESIGIIPEHRGKKGADILIRKMCDIGVSSNIPKYATHARTTNGFNETIRKLFPRQIILTRNLDHWIYGDNEPYEYIEWEL